MGEPIVMKKGKEQQVVYGPHQAASLAAAGWQYTSQAQADAAVKADALIELEGVSEELAEALAIHGYATFEAIADAEMKALTEIAGIGRATAAKIKSAAAARLE